MIYTSYNPATGTILGTLTATNPKDLPAYNTNYITGSYAADRYYISNKTAVEYPPKPYTGSWIVYTWDLSTRTWLVDESVTADHARQIRDNKFIPVDRINPIWWNQMTAQQQAEATAYRQALLDVPNQPGFPTQIEWPAKPAWLI